MTTIFVRIGENREEASVLGYRAKLAELIQRIVEAYWAVVFAVDNLRVQEKSVKLALSCRFRSVTARPEQPLPSAQENLRLQEKRFQVGLITQKDVIDFQSRLIDARGAGLGAVTDYNNAITKLKLAEGTRSETYNVKIEDLKKEANPWWAKF